MHVNRLKNSATKNFITNQGGTLLLYKMFGGQKLAVFDSIQSFPYQTSFSDIEVLSTLDGLLLLWEKITGSLILCNPTTRLTKVLSDYDSEIIFNYKKDTIGIYKDLTNDYKVSHIKRHDDGIHPFVYSIRSASWRSICFYGERKYGTSDYSWSFGTFCGETLCFTVSKNWADFESIVLTYDVNVETFEKISFPCVEDCWVPQVRIVTVKDRLHLFVTKGFPNFSIDLWKLNGEIWTKVLSFQHVRELPFGELCDITHVMTEGTWIWMSAWQQVMELYMDNAHFDYLYHADSFRGIRGAILYESCISPSI